MLFYTAAAIAASIASLGQAIRLETTTSYTDEQLFQMKEAMFPNMGDGEFLDMLDMMNSFKPGGATGGAQGNKAGAGAVVKSPGAAKAQAENQAKTAAKQAENAKK